MPVLDAFPLDFSDPRIQDLRRQLSQLYPTSVAARRVVESAGVDTSLIFFEQAPVDLWQEVLRTSANAGLVRRLVTEVVKLLPAQSPSRPALQALLDDKPVARDGADTDAAGRVTFIDGDDAVMQEEGLLFRDSLMQSTGSVERLLKTLDVLLKLAPAVCKVEATFGAGIKTGTAFRVGRRWLLTNHHVLHNNGAPAQSVALTWGYEEARDRSLPAGTTVAADASTIVGDAADDWAVVACDAMDAALPVVDLANSALPVAEERAFIVQHPGGTRKQIGFVRNTITKVTDRVVHYLTDTQEGSSGSPVFNEHGVIVALHHAGGTPQDVVGRSPMKKNEGILIARVVAGITAKGVSLA